MNADHYLLARDENLPVYYFVSEGIKGKIQKGILFQLIDEEDLLYNLAFGDWNRQVGYLDDMARTGNQDTQKVLNTVARAVVNFIDANPEAQVVARGSTESRTRLYQIHIVKNLESIPKEYDIQGLKDGHWECIKTGVNYDAFLLKIRSLTL